MLSRLLIACLVLFATMATAMPIAPDKGPPDHQQGTVIVPDQTDFSFSTPITMKQPKFKKGDKVKFSLNGDEVQDEVLNVFPVGVGQQNQPIIKPVENMLFSYQLNGVGSLRFNEDDLQPYTAKKASS